MKAQWRLRTPASRRALRDGPCCHCRCGSGRVGRRAHGRLGRDPLVDRAPRTASPSRTSRPRMDSTRQASWSREPVFRFRRRPRLRARRDGHDPFALGRRAARAGGCRVLERDAKRFALELWRRPLPGGPRVRVIARRSSSRSSTTSTSRAQGAPANPPGTSSHETGNCGRRGGAGHARRDRPDRHRLRLGRERSHPSGGTSSTTRNAPGRIRTCDFRLRRAALYPLSYGRS